MSLFKFTLVATSVMLITGCGGGGSDSGATSRTSSAPVSTPATQPAPVPAPVDASEGADDITVDVDFTLSSEAQLQLDINPSVAPGAYLTVCHYNASTRRVDRQSCLYRGPITDDGVYTSVMLAHRDTPLVAEIWMFEEGYQPSQYQWDFENGQQEQVFLVR